MRGDFSNHLVLFDHGGVFLIVDQNELEKFKVLGSCDEGSPNVPTVVRFIIDAQEDLIVGVDDLLNDTEVVGGRQRAESRRYQQSTDDACLQIHNFQKGIVSAGERAPEQGGPQRGRMGKNALDHTVGTSTTKVM